MAIWKFENPDGIEQLVSGEPMGSPKIKSEPVVATLAPSLSFDLLGARLSLNPRAEFSVAVLNDDQDVDEDGVVTASDGDTPIGTLPPHFRSKDGPWLKVRAEAGVKAAVAAELSLVGLTAGGDASIVVADYRRQEAAVTARSALLALAKDARFITEPNHVTNLGVGDALAFRRGGAIVAGIRVTASDIFTGQIGSLGRLLGSKGPVVFALEAGATLDFEVSVSDEFLVVVSRTTKSSWRAGVRRAHASKLSVSADAGITARLKNPGAVKKLAAAALDSAIGAPLAKVKALLAKATLGDLDAAERRLFDVVADRLGVGGVIDSLERLQARVGDLEKKVEQVLTDVVNTRITLSFAYEYQRIATHVNLLQVALDRTAVTRFHADLVAGQTLPLLEAVRNAQPGVTLESYLNQKTLERSRSWGFTLGIGKWVSIGGKDFSTLRQVDRRDIAGAVQRSYLGTRGYKGRWAGESVEWSVDIRADMKKPEPTPKVSHYNFGMHISWAATQKSLSVHELEEWIDLAQLWRVLTDDAAMDLRAALAPVLNHDAEISVHLTVPHTVVRSVLPLLAASTPDQLAPALAAGMPWMPKHPARRSVATRRRLYTPLWQRALADPSLSGDQWGQLAESHLRGAQEDALAFFERHAAQMNNPFSFAGLVQINGNTRETCLRFIEGARKLQATIANNEDDNGAVPRALATMDDLWGQSHHVRAVGARLLDLADSTGQLREVTRTVLAQGGGLAQDLVITA